MNLICLKKLHFLNEQNRVGSIRHLQYELGKVLCDVSSCAGLVIAGCVLLRHI